MKKVFQEVLASDDAALGARYDALVLVPPHGRLIVEGEKTLFIRQAAYPENVGKELYLISGGECFGKIRYESPEAISREEFEELRAKHQVSNDEVRDWWPKEKKLWKYEFELLDKYAPFLSVDVPKVGAETTFIPAQKIRFIDPEPFSLDKDKDISKKETKEKLEGKSFKPQKCKYCDAPAKFSIVWADGRVYIPVCEKHKDKGIAKATENDGRPPVTIRKIKQKDKSKSTKLTRIPKPFGSPGGKSHQVHWLLQAIPEHKTYVECFCGGASLFFAKPPSEIEILNDRDSGIMAAFTWLRDAEAKDFKWFRGQYWSDTGLTEKTEAVFMELRKKPVKELSLGEKAYRHFFLSRFSMLCNRYDYMRNDRTGRRKTQPRFLKNLERYQERLKGVILLEGDWTSTLEYDSPDTFYYLDPLYSPTAINPPTNFNEVTPIEGIAHELNKLKGKFLMHWLKDDSEVVHYLAMAQFKVVTPWDALKNSGPTLSHGRRHSDEYLVSNFPWDLEEEKKEEKEPKQSAKEAKAECIRLIQTHIQNVGNNLDEISAMLQQRGKEHDASKLEDPELAAFIEQTLKLKGLTYGSPEYRDILKEMKPALDHHYQANRHHPEHFAGGIGEMNIVDVVEMFCDWLAAANRHETGCIKASLEINAKRFGISDPLKSILENSIGLLKNEKVVISEDLEIQELQGGHEVFPSEEQKHNFVFQNHYMGQRVHLDFRYEVGGESLRGWTLMHQIAKSIGSDVESLAEAKALERNWKSYFGKINNDPGMQGKKLLAQVKPPQPRKWLTLQGVIPPGQVGADKNKPGVMSIWDRGPLEFGAQQENFHEYFLYGEKFNGRWLIRRLATLSRAKRPVWMSWKAKDPRPYAISEGAVEASWIGPQGISSLPQAIRKQVPTKFHYWVPESEEERLRLRQELVFAIKNNEITFQFKIPGLKMERLDFVFLDEEHNLVEVYL